MMKIIFNDQCACEILFKAMYFIWKQFFLYSKSHALCKLLMYVNIPIKSSMYQDEKTCSDLITCILVVIQKKIICKI